MYDVWQDNLTTETHYTPAQRSCRGVYWIHLVRPSVRPSVCRRHGFRSISQVCFGISIWNFICILMVVIGRSRLIFSDVNFKMAVWQPYWIFWFPDSNFSLALNFNSKLQWQNTYIYTYMYMGRSLLIFSDFIFKMVAWRPYCFFFRFLDSVGGMVSRVLVKFALEFRFKISYAYWCWS